ncbi:hypothetical protein D9M69_536190 [compost metagenome]
MISRSSPFAATVVFRPLSNFSSIRPSFTLTVREALTVYSSCPLTKTSRRFPTLRLSVPVILTSRLPPILVVSLSPMVVVRFSSVEWNSLASTSVQSSRSACSQIRSLPLLSSNMSAFAVAGVPLLERLRKPLCVALSGRSQGGRLLALNTRPITMGRSGWPPIKSTITSSRTRGSWIPPKPPPAQGLDTRTQHELFSSFLP